MQMFTVRNLEILQYRAGDPQVVVGKQIHDSSNGDS